MSFKFRPDLYRIDGEFAQSYPSDLLLFLAAQHEDDGEGIQSVREAINDIGVCAASSKPTDQEIQAGVEVHAIGATNGARVRPLHGFVYKKTTEHEDVEIGVWVSPESRRLNIGKNALVCFLKAQTAGQLPVMDRRSPVTTPALYSNGQYIKNRLPESIVRRGWAPDDSVPVGLLLSAVAIELSDVHPQDKEPLIAAICHGYGVLADRDI